MPLIKRKWRRFTTKLRDMPYQANETVNVLSKMFTLAEACGLTPPRRNPCRPVRKYKEHRRERFLTLYEYRRLGRVLDEAEADGSISPYAIAAIRLLMLTGCRHNEILTLRWDDVDLSLQKTSSTAPHDANRPGVGDVFARHRLGDLLPGSSRFSLTMPHGEFTDGISPIDADVGQTPHADELIVGEVKRPVCVRSNGHRDRRTGSDGAASSAPAAAFHPSSR